MNEIGWFLKKVLPKFYGHHTKGLRMLCPVCRMPMQAKEMEHFDCHICHFCQGAWLKLEENIHLVVSDEEHAKMVTFSRKKVKDIVSCQCPSCHVKLRNVHSKHHYRNIASQLCIECGGMFLNKIDLHLLHIKKIQIHELSNDQYYEKYSGDRDLEITEYIFSFLTGMPVEINIAPQKPAIITHILIFINVAIFAVALFSNSLQSVANSFGVIPSAVNGYALFTSIFLHGGIPHLLGNMYFLYIFGDNVEDRLGKIWYLFFYCMCGIIASLTYVTVHPGDSTPLVGSSGAIAGLMGAYLLACRKAKIGWIILWFPVKLPAFCYFFFWLIMQYVITLGENNVAWEAHVGGFFCGVVLYPIFKNIIAKSFLDRKDYR